MNLSWKIVACSFVSDSAMASQLMSSILVIRKVGKCGDQSRADKGWEGEKIPKYSSVKAEVFLGIERSGAKAVIGFLLLCQIHLFPASVGLLSLFEFNLRFIKSCGDKGEFSCFDILLRNFQKRGNTCFSRVVTWELCSFILKVNFGRTQKNDCARQ